MTPLSADALLFDLGNVVFEPADVAKTLAAILRDADLRSAPQDED